ncbi:CLUMA_CG008254, isoform A [Clunio marinus]|uniref:CLUMA_CG008254, isoform A n=1 Tax=Clunio marinus TaxID=568069 RepID=A0A1J1I380_9DIPT|nr:CLUMA_CG008254, isoform A [Clunio marinus]
MEILLCKEIHHLTCMEMPVIDNRERFLFTDVDMRLTMKIRNEMEVFVDNKEKFLCAFESRCETFVIAFEM